MNFVTFERLSWEPAGRPMNAQSSGVMSVGIWKIETRAGFPSSFSTLRRRRLSASFCTFVAFFSRRLASEMSSETVSRTASRRAVMDLTSDSRRTSSSTAAAAATGATTGATTGAATAATGAAVAEAAAFLPFAATGAAATGAGAATSSFLETTFLAAAGFVDADAELIIPDAEEV